MSFIVSKSTHIQFQYFFFQLNIFGTLWPYPHRTCHIHTRHSNKILSWLGNYNGNKCAQLHRAFRGTDIILSFWHHLVSVLSKMVMRGEIVAWSFYIVLIMYDALFEFLHCLSVQIKSDSRSYWIVSWMMIVTSAKSRSILLFLNNIP